MSDEMKRGFENLRSDFNSTTKAIVNTLVRIESRLDSLDDRVSTMVTRDEFLSRMDAMSAQLEESRLEAKGTRH